MARPSQGEVALDIRDATPDWEPFLAPRAPAGAPNVVFIVWDDVGYGTMDVFGGPVETPTMRRIADRGVCFSNFHTTALCSPTRSSLLTGRNATSNGMATIAEFSSGFPGLSTRIPFENGFISEVLAERGYNTYCVGKWHLTPGEECNLAAYRGRWPLGRGFERFYGFLGGETNQWYPDLHRDNATINAPATPDEGYHLSKDLADQAIRMIRDSKVIDPDKPFFMYLAPGCAHAPHHVFEEWADRYKGTFDQGYEAIREQILARQKQLGLLPADTELSPINPHGEPDRSGPDGQPWPEHEAVRPWDSLSENERRLFARMAEVFAGFVSYTDDQIGRLLDHLEATGELDNTLIVVTSDNGASGDAGPNGTFNERLVFNGVADTTEATLAHIDDLGSPRAYNHYCTGWAWAFDTPFPYWKRWAGYEGGVTDPLVVSWPARIEPSAEVRHQYVHAVDVVPTVYDLLGIDAPAVLRGYPQRPIEGESFAAALTDPDAPEKSTQLYAMLGQRAIYHEGWLATTVHPPFSGWGRYEHDVWELYHLAVDRSQSRDLAASEPERLAALQGLWFEFAGRSHALPLDDRTVLEHGVAERPRSGPERTHCEYYPGTSEVPESCGVSIVGRSYTITAYVDVDAAGAEGVIYAHGGVGGGHSLYLQDRRLRYTFSWIGAQRYDIVAAGELAPGRHVLGVAFECDGPSTDPARPGFAGRITLLVDGTEVGTGDIVTQPGAFSFVGDGICVGRDSASPVTPAYTTPFPFTGGTIERVVVDVSGDASVDHDARAATWLATD